MSRRDQIRMDEAEMQAFIAAHKTIILVSNGHDGFPHPMPMWFFLDAECRFWCTTFRKSQKVLNLRRDPTATLLLEDGVRYRELKGIVVYAETRIIEDAEQVAEIMVRVGRHGAEAPTPQEMPSLRTRMLDMAAKRVALCFTPRRWISWDHAKLEGRY